MSLTNACAAALGPMAQMAVALDSLHVRCQAAIRALNQPAMVIRTDDPRNRASALLQHWKGVSVLASDLPGAARADDPRLRILRAALAQQITNRAAAPQVATNRAGAPQERTNRSPAPKAQEAISWRAMIATGRRDVPARPIGSS